METEIEVLDSGLRVVLAPCEAQSVAFGVFVASGSRHEPKRAAGISHFIEHMLFKGTPTRTPLDITRAIEGRGGNFNACTGEESTVYFAHLPYNYLGEAVDFPALARRLGMGYTFFRRLFREYNGMAPLEYQIALRIRRAAHLLESSDAPIAQIASETGFRTPAYFSRFFREQIGRSPQQYRIASGG